MKKSKNYKLLVLLITGLIIIASCVPPKSFIPVKGTGEAVDRSYSVSGFTGIEVSGGFDVILVQGNEEGVVLTAQENLFEYIEVEVVAGTLRIYTQNNIMSTRSMKARVIFKNLDKLGVSGGGDVTAETAIDVPGLHLTLSGGGNISSVIHSTDLKCEISGGGDARIDGTVGNFNLVLSGGGDIRSDISSKNIGCLISGGGNINLVNKEKADEAKIEISGGGDMNLQLDAENLICSISGGGDATINGSATKFDISLHGGGDLRADQFVAGYVTFQAGGGSDLHIQALKEINGQISGGGDLYYSGTADKVDVDARGGSEIHRN